MNSMKVKKLLHDIEVLLQNKDLERAKKALEKLIKKFPAEVTAINYLANIELQSNQIEKAFNLLKKSIAIMPGQVSANINLGNIYYQKQCFTKAIQHYDLAIDYDPKSIKAYYNKGKSLSALQQYDEALTCYEKTLALDSSDLLAYQNIGFIHNALNHYHQAIEAYKKIISIDSNNIDALYNLGIAYDNLVEFEKAKRIYEQCLAINTNHFEARNNLINIYIKQNKFSIAEKLLKESLDLNPNYSNFLITKANIFKDQSQFEEAKNIYKQVIKNDPSNYKAHLNLGLLYLYLTEFQNGWSEYNYRWQLPDRQMNSSLSQIPKFNNDNEIGEILIWGEQGIGDQIIYASLLQRLNSQLNVTVAIDARLLTLFRDAFTHIKFIANKEIQKHEGFSYQISLTDLGSLFIASVNDLKQQNNAFLKANKEKVGEFKEKYMHKKKRSCGISWRSKNIEFGFAKSINLETLIPIFKANDIEFFDLQYGDTQKERDQLEENHNIKINRIESFDYFNDIDDLVALIDACDFIITTSNVTAHLAGSIGKKTLLLLPAGIGNLWYWHNTKQSLWYPSITILSQERAGDWESIIQKINLQDI